jgi:hypothetical protein
LTAGKMKAFFRITLFLLALNFFAENLGYLTHQLYQFIGMICLAFYGLSIFPFDKKTERRGLLFSGSLLLIVSLFFFSGSILFRLVGTGIFLFSIGLILKSKGSEAKEIPLLLSTVTIYFYISLLYHYSPPFWYGMKQISLYISSVISTLTGVPILFASSFLGLPITFLLLIFILLSFFCSGRKKPVFFFLSLISLLFLSGYYLVLVELLPSLGKSTMQLFSDGENFLRLFLGFLFEKDYPLIQYNYQMNAPLLLFSLSLIPLLLIFWGRDLENTSIALKQGKLKNASARLEQ